MNPIDRLTEAHKNVVEVERKRAVLEFIEGLILDMKGNEVAGHRWSRSDFLKYLQDCLTAIRDEEDGA